MAGVQIKSSIAFFCFIRKAVSVSHSMPSYDYQDYNDDYEEEIEIERRYGWQVTSWILMSLTLILNLAVIFVLLVRQNAYNVVNKGK